MKNYKIWYLRGRASFEIAFHVPLTGSRVYNTRCHIRYTGTAECMYRKQLVQHKASVGGFHRFWHMEIWHIYILWKRDLLIWKCYKCRHSVILGIYIRLKIVIYVPKLYFTLFTAAEESHENKHFHRFARRGLDFFPSHIVKGQGTFELLFVVWFGLAFSKPDYNKHLLHSHKLRESITLYNPHWD